MDNQPVMQPQPIDDMPAGMSPIKKKRKPYWWIIVAIIGILVVVTGGMISMYQYALQPVDGNDSTARKVEIISGTTPDQIGRQLKTEGLIRSELAFSIYTRLKGVRNNLQAGSYQFTPSQSTRDIVATLHEGPDVQEFEVTFLPGATLSDHRTSLLKTGFSEAEIDEAFAATYDHPLFATRPKGADLEGYIFGETHRFVIGTPLTEVLSRFFDDFYAVIESNKLIERYQAQGLSLYEGITLASIIQRESGGDDKAQIAQVFLLRLDRDMELGSDVTYQYIADKLGVPRDVNLDNPYNTRRYPGLPPGPIASPGVASLIAAGAPAEGDYLYFLSGDDDVTYFARTFAEHEANIRAHCQQKCKII